MAATFAQLFFRRPIKNNGNQQQFPAVLLPLAMFLLVVVSPTSSWANPAVMAHQQKMAAAPIIEENNINDVEQRELLALRDLLERRQNEIQQKFFQQQQQPIYGPQQQYFVKDIPMEGEPETDEELAQSEKAKRAQTFVRFGKRAQSFVRFGKRAQTFVRFGKRAQTFVRLGRDVQNQLKQQEQKERN